MAARFHVVVTIAKGEPSAGPGPARARIKWSQTEILQQPLLPSCRTLPKLNRTYEKSMTKSGSKTKGRNFSTKKKKLQSVAFCLRGIKSALGELTVEHWSATKKRLVLTHI